MMEYKVEKGVPIPPRRRGKLKRIIDEMEVGDSVLFTDDLSGFKKRFSEVMANNLIIALKKNGMDGCKRKMNNTNPTETRVWRTK